MKPYIIDVSERAIIVRWGKNNNRYFSATRYGSKEQALVAANELINKLVAEAGNRKRGTILGYDLGTNTGIPGIYRIKSWSKRDQCDIISYQAYYKKETKKIYGCMDGNSGQVIKEELALAKARWYYRYFKRKDNDTQRKAKQVRVDDSQAHTESLRAGV